MGYELTVEFKKVTKSGKILYCWFDRNWERFFAVSAKEVRLSLEKMSDELFKDEDVVQSYVYSSEGNGDCTEKGTNFEIDIKTCDVLDLHDIYSGEGVYVFVQGVDVETAAMVLSKHTCYAVKTEDDTLYRKGNKVSK